MEITRSCTHCKCQFKILKENNCKCTYCIYIVRTFYTKKRKLLESLCTSTENFRELNFINMKKKCVYFHLNEEILNEFFLSNKNEHQNNLANISETSSYLDKYRDKNLLLIGCGSIKRLPVLLSIKKLCLNKLVCLIREKTWAIRYINDWIIAEHEDINEVQNTIIEIDKYKKEKNIEFDAILTYDDYCTILTSYLTQHYDLPGVPFNLSKSIKNKYEFRKLSEYLGISHPNYFLIKSNERTNVIDELRSNYLTSDQKQNDAYVLTTNSKASKFTLPVIIKNTLGVGKDFVKKCETIYSFCEMIEESIKKYENIDLIVEGYYEGHEIDCEVLIQNNQVKSIIVSDNFPPIEPYFFETGGVTPSINLSTRENQAIINLISTWVSKMKLQNGCLHFEAKCKPESIYNQPNFDEYNNLIDHNYFLMPIEINMRLGGAETWSMVKASHDIDLIKEAVNIALGIPLNCADLSYKSSNPRFRSISKDFHPAKNVYIDSIRIDHRKLIEIDQVAEISIFRSVGDVLTVKDYVGWVSVIDNIDSQIMQLTKRLDQVLSCIHFGFSEY